MSRWDDLPSVRLSSLNVGLDRLSELASLVYTASPTAMEAVIAMLKAYRDGGPRDVRLGDIDTPEEAVRILREAGFPDVCVGTNNLGPMVLYSQWGGAAINGPYLFTPYGRRFDVQYGARQDLGFDVLSRGMRTWPESARLVVRALMPADGMVAGE